MEYITMGKQNNNSQNSGMSVSDRAFIAQQASQEFARVFSEIHGIYTDQLKQLSATGSLGAGGIEAQQQLRDASRSAATIQGVGGIVGIAAMGIPVFGPFIGATITAGTSAYGTYQVQNASVEYIQELNAAHGRLMASAIGMTNGGNSSAVYRTFMEGLPPERYGVGLERMSTYADYDTGAVPYGTSNFNQLLRNSMTDFAPEGDPSFVGRQMQAYKQLAALNYKSLGMSPQDFINRGRTVTTPSESAADFDARLKRGGVGLNDDELKVLFNSTGLPDILGDFNDFKAAVKNGIDPSGKVQVHAWGSAVSDTVQISSNAMSDLFNKRRNQVKTETSFSDSDLIENFVMGGPQAIEAMRLIATDSKTFNEQSARVLSGTGQNYLRDQYASARTATQAGIQVMNGRYGDASDNLIKSAGSIRSAANAIASVAFNPDGSVNNDIASQKFSDMIADAVQKELSAKDMTYGAAGISVAKNYSYSNVAQRDYSLYGDQNKLSSGYDRMAEGITADRQRLEARVNAGIFSGPDQEAQMRSQLIELMQKEAAVRVEQVRVLDQVNIKIATFSTGIASAEQRSAYVLGTGGVAGQGYATNTFQQFARRASATARATDDIVASMRNRNMSDDQIANSEVYQNAVMQQRQAEGDANEAFVNQANVPTSVGIRRSISANTFEFNYLQHFPGTAGNIWNVGKNLLSDIERANQEDQARYQQLLQSGAFNAPGGQALAEQFQNRYQDRMQTYGQVYGSLSYDWPNKLAQLVAGSPNTINYISPSLSERVAVGAGIHAPQFGSNSQDLPGYLKEAMNPGSLAGSFGTQEGMAVTGMTGFGGNRGNGGMLPGPGGSGNIVITGELIIRDDGRATIRAKVDPRATTRTSQHDTSSSGLGEFYAMSGRGKTY
jgi:hypothetical protein